MSDSILSFANSASFRNSLISRNLTPYNIPGAYTPPSGQQNYEYSVSNFNVIDSPNDLIANNPFVSDSATLNEYGPNNGYQQAIVNYNLPVDPNQGEYNPNDTVLDLVNEFYIDAAYIENRFGPVGGFQNMVVIDNIQNNNKLYTPYWDPPTFIPSSYSPYAILLSNDPTGSDGLLSQDSFIAKLGALSLKDALQARIDTEIFQRTVGTVNLDALTDPFEIALLATGKEPLIYKNYRITVPENPLVAGAEFITRLSGAIFPLSTIPGDYFDEVEPSAGSSTQISSALNVVNQLTGGFLGPILNKTRNPSELFLANTGNGQRSVLFRSISYNRYQPSYDRNFGGILGIGQAVVNLIANAINPDNGTLVGGYYVGSRNAEPSTITSPPNQLPVDPFGKQVQAPVYGPSELGILYEGNQEQINFGLGGKSFSDDGGIDGQFIWTSPKYKGAAGYKATEGGGIGSIDGEFNEITSQYLKNESTNLTFKQSSILDQTQRLIDSADNVAGIAKLKHVGNAINQVSKVFNDGYKEITKGSKVLSYVDNTTGQERGIEYCRIFAKDTPYYTYNDLQKTDGITTSGRRFSNSVFDNTFNLNIAPIKGEGSTNIKRDAKGNLVAKKYMFSIENLAWRTSSRPGYTYDDLPVCEKGPNGGRVMWFPPYDLKFNDSSSASFNATSFLGRPEPIYTYKETSRKGNISWKIIVDHPSVLNILVDKQLKGIDNPKINSIMDSFFAGCVKYDIYELAKKFNTIPLSDLYTYQEILNNPRLTGEEYQKVVAEIPKESDTGNEEGNTTGAKNPDTTRQTDDPRIAEIQNTFNGIAFYFFDNIPGPNSGVVSSVPYQTTYAAYTAPSFITQYQKNSDSTFNPSSVFCKKNGTIPTADGSTISNTDYCSRATKTTDFFNTVIKPNYEKIAVKEGNFVTKIFQVLSENPKNQVTLNMIGSASAPGSAAYNVDLSKRRVDSVLKFFETYTIGDANLKKFIDNKQFIVKQTSFAGETISIPKGETGDYGFSVNCTENITGGTGVVTTSSQIYSVNAMACRRVRIESINVTIQPQPVNNETGAGNKEVEPQVQLKPIPRIQPTVDVQKKLKEGIGKKILRNLLSECDYFELIEKEAPMVYASFKEKIKYFNPAFHSMTPEGLNSRITFLNQCVRPGETIPIIGTDGKPKYNDSLNTAFGAPPILVLRIGDFYHTKIVPNSVSFTYDPITFDMNPEGIGIQPMIVSVSLDFNIIGGMGLAKPVEELQNALSFNFYANTEVYDERATATEDTSKIDNEIIQALELNQPTVTTNQATPPQPNPGGDTIGSIVTNIPVTGGQTGETSYATIMDQLLTETKTYFETVTNKLESINNSYNYGVVQLLDTNRNYQNGTINLGNNNTQTIRIYGKSDFEKLVDNAFTQVLSDIDSGTNVIIDRLSKIYKNEKTPIPLVKENLKKYIQDLKVDFSSGIATNVQELSTIQQTYIQIIRKLNVVTDKLDGKILETNKPRMYQISPTLLSTGDTFTELTDDYIRIVRAFEDNPVGFNTILYNFYVAFRETYSDGDFRVLDENLLKSKSDKLFYMLMTRIITDKNKKKQFIDSIIKGEELKTWKSPVSLINKFEKIVNDLDGDYSKELNKEEKIFKDLRKDKKFKDLLDGLDDIMYNAGKPRKFNYTTAVDLTAQESKIQNLYKTVNVNTDKTTFDGKITFNG
jgi:Txe/YoeB family toxin of Txe-Axe toxin-antitoxin module